MGFGTRKQYYEVTLTKAGGSICWTGKGPTEAAARAKAKTAANAAGENPTILIETVDSLVGPAPRTFKGNDDLPT